MDEDLEYEAELDKELDNDLEEIEKEVAEELEKTKQSEAELKAASRAEKKARKKSQKEETKAKEEEAKAQEKQNDFIFDQMVAYERENRKKEKIAPKDVCISIQHINKIYANHVQAVFDFSLDIKEREFVVLVGPSGCGKSTTIRMIAGLEDITAGDLYINGVYANDLEPKDRDVAMVFQSYALYPHMTVYQNLAFGLEMRHIPKDEIDIRVHNAAKILEIEEYLDRKPRALSGGQCQRVALGRAIVRNTRIFLMDEPLSNLDAKLRVQMRSELTKLHNELGATTIYVTHDQTEAMTMATRIVVMNKGRVQQIGTPKEIYNHPTNVFVGTFIGSPAMNILEAEYDNGVMTFKNGIKVELPEYKKIHDKFYKGEIDSLSERINERINSYCDIPDKKDPDKIIHREEDDEEVASLISNDKEIIEMRENIEIYKEYLKSKKHPLLFGIRPEDIHLVNEPTLAKNLSKPMKFAIDVAELLGNEYYLHVTFSEGSDLICKASAVNELNRGDNIEFSFDFDKVTLFDKVSEKALK